MFFKNFFRTVLKYANIRIQELKQEYNENASNKYLTVLKEIFQTILQQSETLKKKFLSIQ